MIKLIQPYISFEDVEKEFREVFESGWFTKGPWVDVFRAKISDYVGASYVHLATSATTALTMALKALAIGPGHEVIVSDFSFPATANVVEDLGAIPIFADVDPETYTMRSEELEQKITKKTKAVIFVDALGNPAGVTRIQEICNAHGIPLIEDAACGIGSSENGIKVGQIADISCFSFHPRKLLTTGEGGAITTNNPEWDQFFQVKLNHGAVVENGRFDFVDYGYNYRLPDLQCIMGIKQLAKLDTIVQERLTIRHEYVHLLESYGFIVQKIPVNVVHNVQSLVFTVPQSISRDGLVKHLKEHGVESTIGTYAMGSLTYFRKKYHSVQPTSNSLFEKTITLPCYKGVDVEFICSTITQYVTKGSRN